jgi:NAD(P)-dependent dehydrogenase (short-subunit alcohol dehydrogenase family)
MRQTLRNILALVAAYLVATLVLPSAFSVPTPAKSAVLVTGASSGIGRAAVHALVALGFHVFAGVRKDVDVQALLVSGGKSIRPIILDVTKGETIAAAIAQIKATGMPLVGVVNNAGVTFKRPLETVELSRARQIFEVNYFGVLAVTQAALPLLRESAAAGTGARIVNVGSVQGVISMPLQGLYAGTKFALESLSDTLRMELKSAGISVSMVNPGYINTAIRGKGNVARADLTPYEREHYGAFFDNLAAKAKQHFDLAPPCCAMTDDDIVHALTARKPKTRYYPATGAVKLGKLFPAWLAVIVIKIFHFLPLLDHLSDWIVLNVF